MAVENKEVKEFEDDDFKKDLFASLSRTISNQSEVCEATKTQRKDMGLDVDLPNIGTTLNNKLNQLQQEFKKAGISMYSKKIEEDEFLKLNDIDSSFVANAIILDLAQYAKKGAEETTNYQNMANSIVNIKMQKIRALEQKNPIRQVLAKIKRFFVPLREEDLLYTQEEKQIISQCISDYKATNAQLDKYNLRDNIVSSIVKKIREQKYVAYVVPELLERSVIPDLKKLGLADLIPELQQTLREEYEKDLPDSEIYQIREQEMYLYVPDFNRKTQANGASIEGWYNQIQMLMDERRRRIENGIKLEDFLSIDREVSALDRKEMASNIAKSQKSEAEKNKEEVSTLKEDEEQGNGNISL